MKPKMPQQIWVTDSDGTQYVMLGTHWEETDFGAMTIMLKDEPVATFSNYCAIGFDDKVTEVEFDIDQKWVELAEELEGEE